MSNIAEMTQADLDAFMREHTKKVMRAQERHATRMKAKRAEIAEAKQVILEKGEDVVLCLDCRNGSPQIMSSMLACEQKPRHPIVERRDARATGRLVIDHRPDSWTRFGSPIPTDCLPDTPATFCAIAGDRGIHIGVWLNQEEEDEEGTPTIVPGHQGDAPTSCRVQLSDRLDWIDPKYHTVEPARGSYRGRDGKTKQRREIPWTM